MKVFGNNRLSFVICCVIAILIVWASSYTNNYQMIREKSLASIASIEEIGADASNSLSSFVGNIGVFFTGFEENKQLKQRNEILEQYYYFYKQLLEENKQLHDELKFVESFKPDFITAKIIARNNNATKQQITIAAGLSQGVQKWQVLLLHNQLIGRVVEVYDNLSIVSLLSDSNSRIPVVATESKNKFIASGLGSAYLDCKYLSKQSELTEGELVVTSGDEIDIAPGMIVGIVVKDKNSFYIKPTIDFNKIEFVHVMMPIIAKK